MPRLGRLGARLVFAAVASALLAVGLVATIDTLVLRQEFDRFSRAQQDARATQIVASLADAYARRGGWAGADLAPAEQLAAAGGALLVVYDAAGGDVLVGAAGQMPAEMTRMMHGDPAIGFGSERREPIAVAGRVAGVAVLRFPATDLLPAERDVRDALARAQWLAALAAVLVTVPIAVFFARRIVRPVAALAAATTALGRGERGARAAVVADDEIGDLARGFNAMADDLERGSDLRRKLLADVAHEVRTPLTTIQGHLEALRDGVLPPDRGTFTVLHDEAARLGRLVADLELLARTEAAGLSLERASTDLADAGREATAELGAAFGSKGVALELAIEAGPVVGDASRLSQVARNLLSNALKFTPGGGHVRVSTGRAPGQAYLEVRDDGPGIEPSDLPYVFDRFWRGRNVADVSGSGIGLTVARELARAHGGEITVTSEPGRGAVFRLVLPSDPRVGGRASG